MEKTLCPEKTLVGSYKKDLPERWLIYHQRIFGKD
jgi:hypothetical protein